MQKIDHLELAELIRICRYSSDVDDKVRILYKINAMLPMSERLNFPSLLTKDYVNRALDIIEERVDVAARNKPIATQ